MGLKKVPVKPSISDHRAHASHGFDGVIIVSPIGEIARPTINNVAQGVASFFGYSVRIENLLTNIDFSFDENRKQYHSTPILARLAQRAPEDCVKIVAVTLEDLFIPILTHVYGEAQMDGTACIISTHRLQTDLKAERTTFCERVIKEAIHELGHAFNLKHCKDPACIMHYCRNLNDVDQKSDHYCRYCSILLSDEIKYLASKNVPPVHPN